MLYTLSIFALEPMSWVNKYEWRQFTELESCATGTYWKSMGDAMDISYDKLPSYKDGWRDGLHWLDELSNWGAQYELTHMVPAETNRQCGDALFQSLLPGLAPKNLEIVKEIASVLLGDRLRKALM